MSTSTNAESPAAEMPRVGKPKFPSPTLRQWAVHAGFLLLTLMTTTFSGIVWLAGPDTTATSAQDQTSAGASDSILLFPWYYVRWVLLISWEAITHPPQLALGLKFSIPLLAILAAHESGHYLFCRHYGVDATLPFFIPQPPGLFPGTFGAFIKMKSAVPSRRALFDIGLAGPLAGFIVMIPFAVIGVSTLQHIYIPPGASGLTFNDPLLFRLIARIVGIDLSSSVANPFYLAAWVGALVTALNLMPVGQLDGGHGTFSVFGQRSHYWIGRVAFVSMAAISILGWMWHNSPSGFVYVALLAVMLRLPHPQPQRMEPLGLQRRIVALITLSVFVLCFHPFPITFT
jgi:membrane-associated protease RseP (regulator of RpoE activity)